MRVKVQNMISDNGNSIANQFEVITEKGIYFQSYDSIIALKPKNGKPIQLDINYWDYSKTTGKYRNLFLGEKKIDTQYKIDKGIYKLKNLN